MSMSTPGEIRRPSATKPGATPADGGGPDRAKSGSTPTAKSTSGAKPGGGARGGGGAKTAKAGGGKGGGRGGLGAGGGGKGGGGSGGSKGRKPLVPVKIAQERNWGPIMMFIAAGVVAALIVGFGAYQVWKSGHKADWQAQANGIPGIVNYRKTSPNDLVQSHAWGTLTYKQNPPVGGEHNYNWQDCMGDVYTDPIAKEQAVHSLEHGAVWVTYNPSLPKDQVDKLAAKVRDRSFMLMSPYPDLDKPISLQAWGYQLKVDNANDGRIDRFIQALRQNATMEPQAGCSGGITDATPTPLDLGKPAATPAATPGATPSG
jgi:Protein of unknown function (DUF3105)